MFAKRLTLYYSPVEVYRLSYFRWLSRIVEGDQYLPEQDTVKMFPVRESIVLTI